MNPLFKRQIPFIALLVGLLVFGAAAPQQMVDVGIWALIYGFAAIGLSLLMGLAGQVSLGHAAFIAVGAYTQALLVAKANLNPLLAAPISVVAAMLVALLVGGAVIVGVLSGQSDTVRLRQVVYDQADQTVSELQQLIRQNTR